MSDDLGVELRKLRISEQRKKFASDGGRRRSSLASQKRGSLTGKRNSTKFTNRIELNRLAIHERNTFMSTAIRNPISGVVRLEGLEEWLDFSFVDLWTRPFLLGTPDQLSEDRYMMKPMPLLYRSWVYHCLYQVEQSLGGMRESGEVPAVIRALSTPCIDAPVSGGRWSPVMCLAPQLFPIVLIGDFTLMLLGLMTFLICLLVAVHSNNQKYYRAARLVTFPLRVSFFIGLFGNVSVSSLMGQGKIVGVLGFIITAFISLADFTFGDGVMFLCRSLECSYEVVRELPHNVWVCRRSGGQSTGGFSMQEAKRDRIQIDAGITGVAHWDADPEIVLLADVQGLLVELVRPGKDEWRAQLETYRRSGHPVRYVGQDCFSLTKQTLGDIEDPTRRLKINANSYLVPLDDGRLVGRHEAEAEKVKVEDLESDMGD